MAGILYKNKKTGKKVIWIASATQIFKGGETETLSIFHPPDNGHEIYTMYSNDFDDEFDMVLNP